MKPIFQTQERLERQPMGAGKEREISSFSQQFPFLSHFGPCWRHQGNQKSKNWWQMKCHGKKSWEGVFVSTPIPRENDALALVLNLKVFVFTAYGGGQHQGDSASRISPSCLFITPKIEFRSKTCLEAGIFRLFCCCCWETSLSSKGNPLLL